MSEPGPAQRQRGPWPKRVGRIARALLAALACAACAYSLAALAGVALGLPIWDLGVSGEPVFAVLGALSIPVAVYGFLKYRRTRNRLFLLCFIPLVSVFAFALLLSLCRELDRIYHAITTTLYGPFAE